MAIKRIKVSNFKSFKDLDLELGNFNVIIGPNASGKSNFTQIFKFIRDMTNEGLDNAVSLQGSEYLMNIAGSFPKTLSATFVWEPGVAFGFKATKSMGVEVKQATYQLDLTVKKAMAEFEVKRDELNLQVDYVDWKTRRKRNRAKVKTLGSGNIFLSKKKGTLNVVLKRPAKVKLNSGEILWSKELFWPLGIKRPLPTRGTVLLQMIPLPFWPFEHTFANIGIYDFDPKLSKKAALVTGKSELEENGDNLSLVLKNITEDPERKRKFANLIKDLLPFVDDLKTDKFMDRSLIFKLSETYYKDEYFPASFISDGTVNISALIIALYFEKKDFIVIEEPERNVHPHLISRLMEMMKDASSNKQIIVTTHNPEVVKHADLENILLVSRDKEGFSRISKPGEKERVKIFLKNELGLDELYVQNLLED